MMVAHVEMVHAIAHRRDDFRVAVAKAVGSPVDVDVDQAPAVHVVEVIALAPVDHQVDAGALPFQRLARIPILDGAGNEIVLGFAHRRGPVSIGTLLH